MTVSVFPCGPFETNAYIIACPATQEAAFVDPAPESAAKLERYVQQNDLKPTKILLTHSHWDHIADAAALQKKFNIPIYIHPLDAPNLVQPGSDGLPCWIDIPPISSYKEIKEGDHIDLGECMLSVIHTPGHTPGGVCFYCPEHQFLISGDTLFKGAIGNLSFPTARPQLMGPSLKKLSQLPGETRVYPGHGPSTTISKEKEIFNYYC